MGSFWGCSHSKSPGTSHSSGLASIGSLEFLDFHPRLGVKYLPQPLSEGLLEEREHQEEAKSVTVAL